VHVAMPGFERLWTPLQELTDGARPGSSTTLVEWIGWWRRRRRRTMRIEFNKPTTSMPTADAALDTACDGSESIVERFVHWARVGQKSECRASFFYCFLQPTDGYRSAE